MLGAPHAGSCKLTLDIGRGGCSRHRRRFRRDGFRRRDGDRGRRRRGDRRREPCQPRDTPRGALHRDAHERPSQRASSAPSAPNR
ncbi:hypothetical protein F7R13_35715 [Burkholderia territorii]|uniref:Uncharacterized protein n=1 Tax=Burkholderia territorii TaxID=1503055 RepID=A0A6L3MN16_9BURK|nr:hypothetical protein F7R13_35715 [Burkholderia territorii]